MPRASISEYLLWLAREGLEREHSVAWDSLAADCADIEALEVFPELAAPKVGRNEPGPCGSGKEFKKCSGR